MAMFQQDVNKKLAKKKKLTKEEKKVVKELKRKEKERKRHKKINEKNLKKRKKKAGSKRSRDDYYSTVDGFKPRLSFIETNGRYASILQLDNKYGSNRNMQYGWFINIIPEVNIKGVKATLITKDKLADEDTQRKIVRDRASSVINASEERGDIGNITKENAGDIKLKEFRAEDFKRAQVKDAIQDSESIVDFEVYIMLTSENADKIVQQIDNINTIYNENNKGLQISSVAGRQQELLESIFDPVKGDTNNFNLMTGDYSGNDHMVRKGLNDVEDAVPVGLLTESYTKGISTMSINKRFKGDALIAAPSSDIIDNKFDSNLSASSLWGQLVANDVMVHGHKVFHIVLNDFHYEPDYEGWINVGEDEEGMPEYIWDESYKKEPQFVCQPIVGEELSYYDLSKGGLNPMEMFGEIKKVAAIFNNNIRKLTYMMYLMSTRKLKESEMRTVRSLIIDFYNQRDMWDSRAVENPYAARILNLDSNTVPTMNDFVFKLSNHEISTQKGTEEERNTASVLSDTLEATLESNVQVFGSKTTLPRPNEVKTHQNYYDLSYIDNRDLMEAEFLNIFGYITEAADEDDVVMIHGVDQLTLETLEILRDDLRKLKRKNVRMAYLFDRIGSGDVQKDGKNFIERADVFNTNGYLYTNLERDFGFTILGTMTEDELIKYQNSVRQIFTENMEEALTDTKNRDQYQIRSGEGSEKSTVIVNSYFVI
ncbi:hypothetical protein H3997_11210 [Staphylococcus epidermidis]|uniref:hypothetical protein n=1 Tax=Bacillati TaxID=1783272 RepID=UPI000F54BC10|nr:MULTISPECIES: hypothetical protein [Staphylococcus]MBF2142296.1 hypothetical protein [Staphylococcus epidermidis]MBF2226333.1 hypothetical protein [Staphylococcus epidermidis]MCD9074451.1 hypothetical protein [Staphylococcus epidermidis]RQN00799.1 hypothetical protein CPA43_01160 [Staphylococcus warneri]